MLVLTVKDGDYVMIDNKIMVKVQKNSNQMKLAFDAPKDVQILRGSVFEEQNKNKVYFPDIGV